MRQSCALSLGHDTSPTCISSRLSFKCTLINTSHFFLRRLNCLDSNLQSTWLQSQPFILRQWRPSNRPFGAYIYPQPSSHFTNFICPKRSAITFPAFFEKPSPPLGVSLTKATNHDLQHFKVLFDASFERTFVSSLFFLMIIICFPILLTCIKCGVRSLKLIDMLPINQTKSFLIHSPSFKNGPISFFAFGRWSDSILFPSTIDILSDPSSDPSPIPSTEAYDITFAYTAYHFAQPHVVIMAQRSRDE